MTTGAQEHSQRIGERVKFIERMCERILREHEDWLREQIPTWPKDSCFDTCATIDRAIEEALGCSVTMERGYFFDPEWDEFCREHTWLRLPDSTIIDPTMGQFTGRSPLGVFDSQSRATRLYSHDRTDAGEEAFDLREELARLGGTRPDRIETLVQSYVALRY